ncbi:hypothetical protein HBI10_065990 [Parastagonospora nodorum]|nr:hypothetical protein HBI10_065990 [Parastagonospora nodorum]
MGGTYIVMLPAAHVCTRRELAQHCVHKSCTTTSSHTHPILYYQHASKDQVSSNMQSESRGICGSCTFTLPAIDVVCTGHADYHRMRDCIVDQWVMGIV